MLVSLSKGKIIVLMHGLVLVSNTSSEFVQRFIMNQHTRYNLLCIIIYVLQLIEYYAYLKFAHTFLCLLNIL